MGNSASALPYSIGKERNKGCGDGWIVCDGQRKNDNSPVTVFMAKKPILAKTPCNSNSNSSGGNNTAATADSLSLSTSTSTSTSSTKMQLQPAYHHFMNCKKLRHPHILQVYATLDTDNPNESVATASPQMSTTTSTTTTSTSSSSSSSMLSSSYLSSSSSPKSVGDDGVVIGGNGDLIIVTEPCISLPEWLHSVENPPELEQLAWGLECIIRGLHFMHASANMCHGNLHPNSFVVTPSGDVKLWNFSLVTTISTTTTSNNSAGGGGLSKHFMNYEEVCTSQRYRSPERIDKRWDAISTAGIHIMDSYSISILIQDFFINQEYGIPLPLQKAIQRLQTTNLKMRPRLQPLLKCPVFDTPYQKLQLQLEELTIQSVDKKIAFWNNVTPNIQVGLIPYHMAINKFLPLLITTTTTICQSDSLKSQDLYRKEVLAMLAPMFYIMENLCHNNNNKNTTNTNNNNAAEDNTCSNMSNNNNNNNKLSSIIGMLFGIADRGVRGFLLKKATYLANQLDSHLLNVSVFEPTCSGFNDSSSALRELTLQATCEFLPKLTQPNLEKLSRYLVRLQNDIETTIRTQTVTFFSQLAPYLSDITREKLLLPAFIRAMKDPIPTCRLKALQSIIQSKNFFDHHAIATRVLPAITTQLLDPISDVRKEAFTTVDQLLYMLRQESDRMNHMAQATEAAAAGGGGGGGIDGQQQMNGGGNMMRASSTHSTTSSLGGMSGRGVLSTTTTTTTAAPQSAGAATAIAPPAPSSGSYFSGISSWMSTSTKPDPVVAAAAAVTPPQQPQAAAVAQPNVVVPTTTTTTNNVVTTFDDDGWDDDDDGWDDDDDLDVKPTTTTTTTVPSVGVSRVGLGTTTGTLRMGGSTTTTTTSATGGDFFGSFDGGNKGKPTTTTLNVRPTGSSSRMVGTTTTLAAANKTKSSSGGKLSIPIKKTTTTNAATNKPPPPSVTKLSIDDDKMDDGWDDF